MALGGLVLGTLIHYLRGTRIMMFQLPGFYSMVWGLMLQGFTELGTPVFKGLGLSCSAFRGFSQGSNFGI